ncbi:MAG: NTP transferase domain-containing protein [Planctomycetes bacterium]|nr:NTP transferase domain-containing protein [Planctomycetota bacterium]
MNSPVAVVMAAGKGTRMKSELPKVLIEVCGRPMVFYALEALRRAGVERLLVVIGYRADLVRETLVSESGVTFCEQREQLGTGHAVMMCREALSGHDGPVLVVAGDSPLMQSDSIAALLAAFERDRPACILGTGYRDNPVGLGRIVRDGERRFLGIVEEKDATPQQREIREVNLSCYVFDAKELLWSLDRLENRNAQGEYYITDCPGILLGAGKEVRALDVLKPCEALSINTPEELKAVESYLVSEVSGTTEAQSTQRKKE